MIRTKQINRRVRKRCFAVYSLCTSFATRSASPNYATTRMKSCPFTTMVTVRADLPTMRMESTRRPAIYAIGGMTFWAILSMTQVDSYTP